MARIMNIESKVDRAMRRLLNELYMSGFDKTMILRMFPIKPTIPKINRKLLKAEVLDDQRSPLGGKLGYKIFLETSEGNSSRKISQ